VELWSLSSETLEALERLDIKEMVFEFKQLKKELEEHGKVAYEFHKRRSLETGTARWEPKMQEKIAKFSVLQEQDTPQSKAATAAAARKLEEKEKRAGNFCSAIEDGAATVEKVLNQKVYTKNEKLKQRIHPVLLQPLAITEKTLPNILSKRKKNFEAPTTVDLTAGIPEGVDSMQKMNFQEVGTIFFIFLAILPLISAKGKQSDSLRVFAQPFRISESGLPERNRRIHDRLDYAVHMYDAYSSIAMVSRCKCSRTPMCCKCRFLHS
jgi:hypothetical protein